MKCPRCQERFKPEQNEGKTARVATGEGKLEYLIACYTCSWQVPAKELIAWLKRWGYRK